MWKEHLAVCTLYLLCVACQGEDLHQSDGETKSLMHLENLISKYSSSAALSRHEFMSMYASLQVKDLSPDSAKHGSDEAQWCTQMFANTSCTDKILKRKIMEFSHRLTLDHTYELPKLLRLTVKYDIKCGTGDDVFTMYAVDDHLNASLLHEALPAVVMSMEADHCRHKGSHGHEGARHRKIPSRKEVWAYGVGFVVLICIVSNLGACLAPLMNSSFFKMLLMFLVSTAVGTLSATGLLVLLPEALDLMSIEETADDYIWKTSTVLGGIVFFYMSERVLKSIFKGSENEKKHSSTEVGVKDYELEVEMTALQPDANGPSDIEDKQPASLPRIEQNPIKKEKKKVQTVAWVMLLGDALHKAVDGLAVGAAYSKSIKTGLSLSIAILCEEIPHELGDVAILLHAGMTMKKALFCNTLSAVCGIIGLVGGISLGEDPAANQWIFAVAAGIFLYVPLVDMLPEMSEAADKAVANGSGAFGVTLIQLLGLCCGFAVILVVALYAGDIQV